MLDSPSGFQVNYTQDRHQLARPTSWSLGGSWLVISRVKSRVTAVRTHITGLKTLLITTHEPPSMTLLLREQHAECCAVKVQSCSWAQCPETLKPFI